MEKYAKDVVIESNTLENMVSQGILPSVYGFRKNLIDSLVGQKALGLALDSSPENKILAKVLKLTTELQSANDLLKTQIDKLNSIEDEVEQADYAALNLVGQIKTVRSAVDALEEICPDAGWPYPKYAELLF
jgi:glutamine synthetase